MSNRGSSSSGGDGMWIFYLVGFILIGGGIALWWLYRLIAWAVLLLVRDSIVHAFGETFCEQSEQAAVVVWRVVVPILLFILGFGVVYSQLAYPSRFVPWVVNVPLSACSGGVLVYHYLRLYVEKPPKHFTWSRFLAADIKLRSDLKLAWIEETLRWKL